LVCVFAAHFSLRRRARLHIETRQAASLREIRRPFRGRASTLKQSDPIYELLSRAKTIAVVGLSESPMRPSHGVSAYMQAVGYKIIPVNPRIAEALGEKAYPSLLEVPLEMRERIDLVDVFRRPEYVDEIVEQAIQLKIPAIWMQEGVINEGAAEKARKAGMFVVMDRCVLKEHRARFG
jgi:predicted CoA-binding protein